MKTVPTYYAVIPANVRYDKNLRANEKLLYGEITALTNKTGECWATNNYFAEVYQVTPQAISKWISNLAKQRYITVEYHYRENTKEIESRVIRIADVSTNIDEVSTNVSRGINKCLGGYKQTIKENNTRVNNTRDNKNNVHSDFESLWDEYPRKQGKQQAEKAFYKAIKNGVTVEEIRQGIRAYTAYIKKERTPDKYIKMGSTFFNGGCWADDYGVAPIEQSKDLDGIF